MILFIQSKNNADIERLMKIHTTNIPKDETEKKPNYILWIVNVSIIIIGGGTFVYLNYENKKAKEKAAEKKKKDDEIRKAHIVEPKEKTPEEIQVSEFKKKEKELESAEKNNVKQLAKKLRDLEKKSIKYIVYLQKVKEKDIKEVISNEVLEAKKKEYEANMKEYMDILKKYWTDNLGQNGGKAPKINIPLIFKTLKCILGNESDDLKKLLNSNILSLDEQYYDFNKDRKSLDNTRANTSREICQYFAQMIFKLFNFNNYFDIKDSEAQKKINELFKKQSSNDSVEEWVFSGKYAYEMFNEFPFNPMEFDITPIDSDKRKKIVDEYNKKLDKYNNSTNPDAVEPVKPYLPPRNLREIMEFICNNVPYNTYSLNASNIIHFLGISDALTYLKKYYNFDKYNLMDGAILNNEFNKLQKFLNNFTELLDVCNPKKYPYNNNSSVRFSNGKVRGYGITELDKDEKQYDELFFKDEILPSFSIGLTPASIMLGLFNGDNTEIKVLPDGLLRYIMARYPFLAKNPDRLINEVVESLSRFVRNKHKNSIDNTNNPNPTPAP